VLAVGHDGREDTVGEAPPEPAVACVEGVRTAVALLRIARGHAPAARAGGEVDEAVHHGRRTMNRRGGGEPPDPVTGCGAEGVEVAVVGSDVDPAVPDGGRRVDVGAGPLRPEQPSARRAERVQRPVRVADEDPAVRDRRRRVEELAPAEAGERLGPPAQPAGAGVDCIETAAVGAEVDLPVRERGRAVDLVVGRERPARLAGVDVDRVEPVVPRAGVERLADDERRRLEDARPVPPDDFSGPRGHGGDHSRLAAREAVAGQRLHPRVVDDPVGDRGGCG
jgi:hypothetical protein